MTKELVTFFRTPNLEGEPFVEGSAGVLNYYSKVVFGVKRFYLVNSIERAAIYDLTATKTILPMHMNALKALGFELKEIDVPENIKNDFYK